MKSLSHVRLLATPWTEAHQASPSMGFSRQKYWSGGTIAFSLMLSLAHNQCSENGTADDDGGGGDDGGDDHKSNAENYSENGDALLEDKEKQESMQLNIASSEQGGNYSVSGGIKWHEINQDILDMELLKGFRRKPTEGDGLIARVPTVSL